MRIGVKNVLFSENLASFVFLKHRFGDSSFRLITDQLKVGIQSMFETASVNQNFHNNIFIAAFPHRHLLNGKTIAMCEICP